MEEAGTQRLVRNEALFREVNERINGFAASLDSVEETYEYLCECADAECTGRIPLTFAEYEAIRADPTRFVICPGHDVPAIESVVKRDDDHEVVEKVGAAGEEAIRLDPRAA